MSSQESHLAKATVRGTLWNYAGYISGRLVAFVTMLILARLLTKDDFGVAAYAGIVTGFIDVIAGLGITNAIIYYKDKEGITDTAFWLNIASSLVIFTITWFGAPLAGAFFNDPRAIPVLRVLIFIYPLSALSYIHNALLQKRLSFGRRFVPSLIGAIIKALISIPMAYTGYGYWSIVVGQIGGQIATTISFWFVLHWKPKIVYNRTYTKPLLTYGLSLVLLDVINSVVNQMDFLMIGRFLGSAALGIYSMAFRIPEILIPMFCSAVASVIFPIFTSIQDDLEMLKRGFLKTTQYMVLLIAPIGLGLALTARPIVMVFLSDKWLEAIPIIRAVALLFTIQAIPYSAGVIYKARGRQVILIYLTIIQFLVATPLIWLATTAYASITYVAWAQVVSSTVVSILGVIIASKLIHLSIKEITVSLAPVIIASTVMIFAVLVVLYLTDSMTATPQLILCIATGAVAYGGSIFLVKRELILQMSQTLKKSLSRG